MNRIVMRTILFSAALLLVAGTAAAAEDDLQDVRKGRWDVTGFTGFVQSNDLDRTSGSSKDTLSIDGAAFIGIRADAHTGEHVSFGLSTAFTRPDFEFKFDDSSSGLKGTENGDFALLWIDADLTWRWLRTRSTPYAIFGIGAFNISDKRIMTTSGDVFIAEQHLEWHVGVGYEWWVGDHVLVNLGARASTVSLQMWPDNLTFVEGIIGIGYRSGPPDSDRGWSR